MNKTLVITDPLEVAKELFNLIKPDLQVEMERLFDNKGKDDELITVKDAMKILNFKSPYPIYDRMNDGRLTRFKTGIKVLLSKKEVLNLAQVI